MARQKIDLTGKEYGRLTVIREAQYKNDTGRAKWLCKCKCGNQTVVYSNNLRQGSTSSCGCYKKERFKNFWGIDSKSKKQYCDNKPRVSIKDKYGF